MPTSTEIPAPPAADQSGVTGARGVLFDIARQIGGRAVNSALGVVALVLLARLLGEEDYGRWTTILAIIALTSPLAELGLQQVAVQRAAANPEREGSWIGALLATRSALALAATAICAVAIIAVADGRAMVVAGLVVCATTLFAPASALAAYFQLRVRNHLSIVVMTVNSILWTGAIIAIAATGGGLIAVAVAFAGAAAVTAALQAGLALRCGTPSLVSLRGHAAELIRVGLPLTVSGLLVLGYSRIDQVIIFHYVGERGAGLYGAANRLLEQAVVIPGAVATTLLPVLTRARQRSDREVFRIYQLALEAVVAISLGALAFAIVCGGSTLAMLFGPAYADAGPTFAILMAVFVGISVGYLSGSAVLLWDLQRRYVVYALIGFIVNVLANLWLVPRYGYVAAAWTTLATEIVVVGLTWRAALRAMNWRPRLDIIARATVAAAATSAGLYAGQSIGLPIGVLIAITPPLHLGLLIACGGLRTQELIALVRGRRAP